MLRNLIFDANALSQKAKEIEWEFQWKTMILSELKYIKLVIITSIYGCSYTLKYKPILFYRIFKSLFMT